MAQELNESCIEYDMTRSNKLLLAWLRWDDYCGLYFNPLICEGKMSHMSPWQKS
jgi:hypothetical protein